MAINENIIGDNIKRIRKEKKITQKELGEMLGVSQSAINQFENNKSTPKTQTLQKIADALDVPISFLMGFDLFNSKLKKNPKILELYAGSAQKQVENIINKQKEERLLFCFDDLYDTGKEKAIEQVELLTKIPEYKKDPGNDNQDQE